MDRKQPQSDYSPLELDTSGAERRYVKIDESTDLELAYEDQVMTPAEAERRNEIFARHNQPFRWRVYGTKEEAA